LAELRARCQVGDALIRISALLLHGAERESD
jgi:hypothetical protein